MEKTLVVILGPTGIGKTEVAIEVAKAFDTEIISADARQIYKEMEIGTAKPSPSQLMEVKHHFINTLSITESYNVGQYEQDAMKVLEELYKKKDTAVMVGGSGLYIYALCHGIDEITTSDEDIRKELMLQLNTKGLASLQEELKIADPAYYKEADLANTHRIIRALEVYRKTGLPYSSFRISKKKERPFKVIKIGLNIDRKELYNRINARVDAMIDAGLEDEVKSLLPYKNYNSMNTVGYSEWLAYFDGKFTKEQTINYIKQNTRRYAKRQLTWFRRDPEIVWFKPDDAKNIIAYIKTML